MFDSHREYAGTWKVGLLSLFLSASLCAADFSSYRGFTFGADVATIAKQAGLKPADAKVIQQKPVLLQEIDWDPGLAAAEAPSRKDPVHNGVLSFFEGKLYRIVVVYDSYKVAGMTVDDMIDSISQTYGVAKKPGIEISFHSYYGEVAKVLARWENEEYVYDLVRSGDQSSFALVMYSKQRDASAQAAIVEASRLYALDAPRRVLEADKKRVEDERLALEKTRAENKPNFKP
jgi:hypothetical protein